MKTAKRILSMLLCLALVIGFIPTFPTHVHAAGTATYEKVTTAPDDWSGEYLIVYEYGNLIFNGSLATLDASSNYVSVTISNNQIQIDPKYAFTIEKNGDNYTIKSGSGYYIGNTADKNQILSNQSTTYDNTISMNTDGCTFVNDVRL